MAACPVCNNLQVDKKTNEPPDESTWTGEQRLQTFMLYESIRTWFDSVEAGCATCKLIWDALLHADKDLVLEVLSLAEKAETQEDEDNQAVVHVGGKLGESLMVDLDLLPPGKRFSGVELYASHGARSLASYPIIGTAGDIAPALDLSRCIELCRRWTAVCRREHPQCATNSAQKLPTRVLDLGDISSDVNVRLFEPSAGFTASYIALSYCWGRVGNLTTTTTNINERKAGIPWDLLSPLFRDAISVTRGLNIRYLWIDALCIIQDSASDWEQEAARMADVYENAFLTIASESAKDPRTGILTPRHTEWVATADALFKPDEERLSRRYSVLDLRIRDEKGQDCTVHVREPLMHNDMTLPRSYHDITYQLLSRAWTLQERLLARRTLHFTAFELVWECKETLMCECGMVEREFAGLDGDHSPKVAYERAMAQKAKEIAEAEAKSQSTPSEKWATLNQAPRWKESTRTWTRLVGGYSARRLTYISDKLPAVSGLARRFYPQQEADAASNYYLAGLWRQDLPWLLCWRAFQWRFEHRTVDYCAPTWSWVSMTSPVIWDASTFDSVSRVEVIDAVTTPQGMDRFGKVSAGRIRVRGQVQRATISLKVNNSHVVGLRNEGTGERIFFVADQNSPGDDHRFQDYDHDPPSRAMQRTAYCLGEGDPVACLWVLEDRNEDEVYGLVLAEADQVSAKRSVPETGRFGAVFERVGVITPMSSWSYQKDEVEARQWFGGAKEEVITII